MRVTYKLEKDDYFNFNLHHMQNFPKIRRSVKLQRFLMPVLFTVIAFFIKKSGKHDIETILPIYIATAGGWIFLYPRFLKRSMKKRLNKILSSEENKMLLEERTIEVNKKGIYEIVKDEKGKEKSLFASRDIIDVEEKNEAIYIYLKSESAYIIPIKYFENEEDKDRFISKVSKFKK